MCVVNNGFSGAQPPTRSLLTLGLNITPEDNGLEKKPKGNIKNQIDYVTINMDSEGQYNKPRHTQGQNVEVIIPSYKYT